MSDLQIACFSENVYKVFSFLQTYCYSTACKYCIVSIEV